MPKKPPLADERVQLIRWILNVKDANGRYVGTTREKAQGIELGEPISDEVPPEVISSKRGASKA